MINAETPPRGRLQPSEQVRLKSDPRFRSIVVIALTAYAMKGDEAKAFAAGCDGYITKPIDTRILPEVIARHLAERRSANEASAHQNVGPT